MTERMLFVNVRPTTTNGMISTSESTAVIRAAARVRRPRSRRRNNSYSGHVAKHRIAAHRIAEMNGRSTNPQPTTIAADDGQPCDLLDGLLVLYHPSPDLLFTI